MSNFTARLRWLTPADVCDRAGTPRKLDTHRAVSSGAGWEPPPRVYCVFSYGHAAIAGTAVYLMEGVSISLNADKSVILVEHVDVSDSSA